MKQEVSFYSGGERIAATLMLPTGTSRKKPSPAVVQGPGWLGLRTAKLYRPYHDALTAAGFAVLVFDYRGFGDSEGSAQFLDPRSQVDDYRNAATYLETREDIDADRLGAFGSGGTGGGNAIMAAGLDRRFRAVVSQVPIADGSDWLHRMRREYEWLEFRERISADARTRALNGIGEMVSPRHDIMVPTPERASTNVKSDVDSRVPTEVALASAAAILEYRPIDVVHQIAPRAAMFICVENDATTPEDHARALYDRAGEPKQLVVQRHTSHYGAYAKYSAIIAPLIVEWFQTYLRSGNVQLREAVPTATLTYLSDES